MFANFFAANDQDRFQPPNGWDFSIYSLNPKSFWFSKTELPISSGCEIVRWDFHGAIRFRASLSRPRLQINFIDSYSSVASRLQGKGQIESVVMITAHDHAWDGLTDVGALGIEINFDENLASQILNSDIETRLNSMVGANRSLIIPVTPSAQRLKDLALRYLEFSDERSRLPHRTIIGSVVEPTRIDLTSEFISGGDLRQTMIVEMAKNIIDEGTHADLPVPHIGTQRRREIALEVERILWQPPFLSDKFFVETLDEFASHFKVSTRTIQTAIQEQFGLGFVAFRRLVRYTQLRRAILSSHGSKTLSALATEHRLHLGRLSSEYREIFGLRPSYELSLLKRSLAV